MPTDEIPIFVLTEKVNMYRDVDVSVFFDGNGLFIYAARQACLISKQTRLASSLQLISGERCAGE